MNCLSCEETLPKRVGVPKITASAHSTSSGVATAMWAVAVWLAAQAGLESMAACGASSAALSRRTSAPDLMPTSCSSLAISVMVPVAE